MVYYSPRLSTKQLLTSFSQATPIEVYNSDEATGIRKSQKEVEGGTSNQVIFAYSQDVTASDSDEQDEYTIDSSIGESSGISKGSYHNTLSSKTLDDEDTPLENGQTMALYNLYQSARDAISNERNFEAFITAALAPIKCQLTDRLAMELATQYASEDVSEQIECSGSGETSSNPSGEQDLGADIASSSLSNLKGKKRAAENENNGEEDQSWSPEAKREKKSTNSTDKLPCPYFVYCPTIFGVSTSTKYYACGQGFSEISRLK